MSYSETITRTDLTNILNELLPLPMHTAKIGEIIAYAGNNEPLGWLKCDGRAVSRTTYSALFTVIGTTYGSGDGSTTFNLPNLVDRFPVGAGNLYDLNDKDGSKDAVVISHTHKVSSGWQTASGQPDRITYTGVSGDYKNSGYGNVQFLEDVGVSGTDKNMPPYIGINYLIYVGGDFAPIDVTPSMDDWIIEQGTSGIWTYRKWNSGIAECWGINSASVTCSVISSPWIRGSMNNINFPSSLFNDTPLVMLTGFNAEWVSLASHSKDAISTIYIYTVATGTSTRSVRIHAIGTWK